MRGLLIMIFITLTSLSGYLSAQDAVFSQMMNARNLLNPALMAIQNNALEASINFREQGASVSDGLPVRTFQALANFSHTSFKVDQISYGLSILGDKGGTGHVGSNMAHLNFSYLKKLTGRYSKVGEHYIGIGTSVGAGQRTVGWNRFWFGNQFNREFYYIDNNVDPKETDLLSGARGQTGIIADLNAGISWYANLAEGLATQAGFSIFHLNRPNISLFQNGDEQQKLRYNAHFSLSKSIYDNLNLVPQLMFIRQGFSQQILIGTELEIDNLDESEFVMRFGVLTRVVNHSRNAGLDALVLTTNIMYNGFKFGVAYDITISSLSRYNNGRGAWELNLGYAFDGREKSGFSRKSEKFKF